MLLRGLASPIIRISTLASSCTILPLFSLFELTYLGYRPMLKSFIRCLEFMTCWLCAVIINTGNECIVHYEHFLLRLTIQQTNDKSGSERKHLLIHITCLGVEVGHNHCGHAKHTL
jgi:hypothetical protein